MRSITVLLVLLLTATSARAQSASDADVLQWTSRVGQMLYRYFSSLDVAVAAIEERSGTTSLPPLYVSSTG